MAKTLKDNVGKFNDDVLANGGYQYTTNASYSSAVANQRITRGVMACVPPGVSSLIDIGCGDGTYAAELAALLPGVEIVGVDPASDAVKRARSLNLPVTFEVADLLEPKTLPKRIFDVGIVRGVIHHLPAGASGIMNAAQICKTLILVEPNGNNPILKWIEKHSRYHVEHEEQSFTARELVSWCRSAGFQQIEIDYIGFVPMFFPTELSKIINFFVPLLERIYPIKKYFAAQVVLKCTGRS